MTARLYFSFLVSLVGLSSSVIWIIEQIFMKNIFFKFNEFFNIENSATFLKFNLLLHLKI